MPISRPLFAFICVGLLAFPLVGSAAQDDTAPSGIVPTTATLDQVLAGYDKMRAANHWATRVESGNEIVFGMKGSYHEISSGDDYKNSETLNGLSTQDGQLDDRSWYQNENGVVVIQHNLHPESEIATSALIHHANNGNAGLTLVGESASPAAYVIEIHSAGGRHEWRFLDRTSYQLVRLVAVYPDKRETTAFDDFRKVDGVVEPWHVHKSDGRPQNEQDFVTTSLRFNVPVQSSDLEIPLSSDNLVLFPPGAQTVRLPAKILNNDIVVTVTIGDRGYDFLLDSGAGEILLDGNVANKLGLTMFGESVQTDAGTHEHKQAIVPDMRIGSLDMKNVVVGTSTFTQREEVGTEIVGLLGFDFIANTALKVDYQNGTVDAVPPLLFVPPADGVGLEASWDDGSPRVPVQVGDTAGNFIFDTGAFSAVVFLRFAQAHPDALKDEGEGSRLSSEIPFGIQSTGVGGSLSMKPVQIKQFAVGGVNYQDFLMWEITDNRGFNYEDIDGLLGGEFLKYFTVYFDYKDNHIYLIRNTVR